MFYKCARISATSLLNLVLIASSASAANIGSQKTIDEVIAKKIVEIENNNKFCHKATKAKYTNIRDEWEEFNARADQDISRGKLADKKRLTISGVELDVYDITNLPYAFHIHTTAITKEKAEHIKNYVQGSHDGQLNLDLCPLLSTSIIDRFMNGYTENLCNCGSEMQIHLIIKADPRSIVWMEPWDAYSPAKGAIHKYLNNTSGRETMVNTFTDHLSTIISPTQLLRDSHIKRESKIRAEQGFNEVVVLGNSYTHFFQDAKDIEIIGIAISSYWLARRTAPSSEDILALKDLGDSLPIFYYEPEIENFISLNILFNYRTDPSKWVSLLRNDFLQRRSSVLFGVPYEYAFQTDERVSEMAPELKDFVAAYDEFISYLYRRNQNEIDTKTLYALLREMIRSNLVLGIKDMDIKFQKDESMRDDWFYLLKYNRFRRLLIALDSL